MQIKRIRDVSRAAEVVLPSLDLHRGRLDPNLIPFDEVSVRQAT